MTKTWISAALAVVAGLTVAFPAAAEPAADSGGAKKHPPSHDLANEATNPGAALIQLQLQNVFVPNSHNSSGYANTGIIQPVIPFKLPSGFYFQNLINRSTLPIVSTPNPNGPIASVTGLGDLT